VDATAPGFTIQVTPASLTAVNVGQDLQSMVTLTGTNGFTGAVTLTCDITPNSSPDVPTCFFFDNTLNLDSSVTPSGTTLDIGLVPPSCEDFTSGAPPGKIRRDGSRPMAAAAGVFLLVLLMCSSRLIPARHRTKVVCAALICVMGLAMAGCGSGSKYSGPECGVGVPDPGTLPGTYMITITATSGNITHTVTVPLTVLAP